MNVLAAARSRFGRWTWCRAFVAVLLLLAPLVAEQAQALPTRSAVVGDRDFFRAPAAALTRPLGQIAQGPCNTVYGVGCEGGPEPMPEGFWESWPMTVPGLGVPLGGVGAGSFMVNQAGTFGPWNFGGGQSKAWEMRSLPQAAFHVREQVGDAAPMVRTLATAQHNAGSLGPVPYRTWGSPLPAWKLLSPGEGTYSALYPFGWMSYKPFQDDISMRFFSPIIAREDRRTSLPVAYFDVRVANHTSHRNKVSVMLTMPNAAEHVGTSPATVREGLSSLRTYDARTGVHAVTLRSDGRGNTPDAAHSEWTIAASPGPGATVSYTPSWNAAGSGSDVYAPFAKTGKLPDRALDHSASAGAIAVSVNLAPGEVRTVPFALSWDFPQISFSDNKTVWMRRYTNFYGAKETRTNDYIRGSYPFHQSLAIARDGLVDHDPALAAVEKWWRPIATDTAYPSVLRTAALNELYQVVFNNSFWEGGLVSNQVPATGGRRLGTVAPGTHLFDIYDNAAGGDTSNEIDVDSHGSLAYDLLFPNLERDRLRAHLEAIIRDPSGNPAKNLVDMAQDPFITWNLGSAPHPGADSWLDVPSKLIYRAYTYARSTDDMTFLRASYPAMEKTFAWLQAHVPPGTHLPLDTPGDGPSTYDVMPVHGSSVYNSGLYLLSLEILIDTGTRLHKPPASLDPYKSALTAAKAEFELLFWDPTLHYKFDTGGGPNADRILLDTFYAQTIAEHFGLPDLVNPQRMREQLSASYSKFMQARDSRGMPVGAPNTISAYGLPEPPSSFGQGAPEQNEVWVGTDYFVGATYYAAGTRFHDTTLKRQGIDMASSVAEQVWLHDDLGFAFDTPEGWNLGDLTAYRYAGYARPMAIWQIIDTIKPVTFDTAVPETRGKTPATAGNSPGNPHADTSNTLPTTGLPGALAGAATLALLTGLTLRRLTTRPRPSPV